MAKPYTDDELFGLPAERITKSLALAALGCSQTHLAKKILRCPESTVTRWRQYVPKQWHRKIRAALAKRA